MNINKEWHEANRMPKNPTLEERIRWHKKHAQHCACRPVPPALREQIEKQAKEKR